MCIAEYSTQRAFKSIYLTLEISNYNVDHKFKTEQAFGADSLQFRIIFLRLKPKIKEVISYLSWLITSYLCFITYCRELKWYTTNSHWQSETKLHVCAIWWQHLGLRQPVWGSFYKTDLLVISVWSTSDTSHTFLPKCSDATADPRVAFSACFCFHCVIKIWQSNRHSQRCSIASVMAVCARLNWRKSTMSTCVPQVQYCCSTVQNFTEQKHDTWKGANWPCLQIKKGSPISCLDPGCSKQMALQFSFLEIYPRRHAARAPEQGAQGEPRLPLICRQCRTALPAKGHL